MKLASLAAVVAAVVGCVSAWGQERAELYSSRKYLLSENRLARPLEVEAGYMSYKYEEPGLMSLTGQMAALNLAYRYQFQTYTPMWLRLSGELAGSTTMTYDGAVYITERKGNKVIRRVEPLSSSSNDMFYDVRLAYGINAVDLPGSTLETFAGIGWWKLHNKANNSAAYSRETTYLYLPVGADYFYRLTPGLTATAGMEYAYFLSGKVTSRMSELDSSWEDLHHTQSSGSGAKLKLGAEYNLGRHPVVAELYYRTWTIEASDTVFSDHGDGPTSWVEPYNTTKIIGLNLGTRF